MVRHVRSDASMVRHVRSAWSDMSDQMPAWSDMSGQPSALKACTLLTARAYLGQQVKGDHASVPSGTVRQAQPLQRVLVPSFPPCVECCSGVGVGGGVGSGWEGYT